MTRLEYEKPRPDEPPPRGLAVGLAIVLLVFAVYFAWRYLG